MYFVSLINLVLPDVRKLVSTLTQIKGVTETL